MQSHLWKLQDNLVALPRPHNPLQFSETKAISDLITSLVKLPDALLGLYIVQPQIGDNENPALFGVPFVDLDQL